ncbi:hypothetical protein P1X14_08070 [Sphingomonas sp. AOB5]|uniref:SMI1/KNR4 family protein n=1 Tax=Sphingomonas sp. AOB5 TaxID=3034017 RepID=UPI0023F8AD20|nr:SMI1/KNR4 family protein [Sphingomonas sp. AOB5]MDF7775198.1 hypothetical protein [Sphingomonas sp. AOB5]
MDGVRVSVDGIFSALERLGRGVATARQDGVAQASIEQAFAAFGLDLPPYLAALYACSDGLEGPDDATIDEVLFFPGYYWLSFAGAAETYASIADDEEWQRGWFPVFASGGGDFYVVICDRSSPDFGAVLGFLAGEPDHLVEFENLAAMMEVIEASFRDGAFFVEDGYLEADYGRMRELSRALQPGFEEHDPA